MRFPYGYHGRIRAFPGIPGTAGDTIPDAYAFTDQTNVALSSVIQSNVITPTGFTSTTTISISGAGAQYRINGGSYTSSSGSFSPGDTLQLRTTSSGSATTAVTATPNVGGVTDTWSVTTSSGSQAVLSPSDLSFDGWYSFATTGGMGNGGDAPVSLAIRHVAGKVRLFTWVQFDGSDYPVTEYEIPTASPASTIAGATDLDFNRYWGLIRVGHVDTDGGSDGNITGGMWYDINLNALWWAYGSNYVPSFVHPTLCCTLLNDTTGVATTYGPWRGAGIDSSRYLGGAITAIPSAYSSLVSGATVVQMGVLYSGANSCPQGANLHALILPTPTTETANTLSGGDTGFTQTTLIRHDSTHPQSRSTNYAWCQWGTGDYDPRNGISITDGTADWGGASLGTNALAASTDAMTNVFWIHTAAKRAVLYFGQLMTTPSGFTPVGDDKIHFGYAPNNYASITGATASGYQDNHCAHAQVIATEGWESTGPWCAYTQATGWIYDPNDFASVVATTTPVYGLTPVHNEFKLGDYIAPLNFTPATVITDFGTQASGNIGGGVFDEVNKKIYLPVKIDMDTAYPYQRYAIAVISVNC